MKRLLYFLVLFWIIPAAIQISAESQSSQTPVAECQEKGSVGYDVALQPEEDFTLTFAYYLPPCYQQNPAAAYPVLYLMGMDAQAPQMVAELIRNHEIPPVILIMPGTTIIRSEYDEMIVTYLIPYVNAHLRIRQESQYRGIGGISHAAAIASRVAFQAPGAFGKVAAISGGIDESEQEQFAAWIAATPRADLPRVLIDIGDRDGSLLPYANGLKNILSDRQVAYEFSMGQGGHNWGYWGGRLKMYLLWFAKNW